MSCPVSKLCETFCTEGEGGGCCCCCFRSSTDRNALCLHWHTCLTLIQGQQASLKPRQGDVVASLSSYLIICLPPTQINGRHAVYVSKAACSQSKTLQFLLAPWGVAAFRYLLTLFKLITDAFWSRLALDGQSPTLCTEYRITNKQSSGSCSLSYSGGPTASTDSSSRPPPTAQSPGTWCAPEVRTNNGHLCKETDTPLFMLLFLHLFSIRLPL